MMKNSSTKKKKVSDLDLRRAGEVTVRKLQKEDSLMQVWKKTEWIKKFYQGKTATLLLNWVS